MGTTAAQSDQEEEVRIALDNVGASAWEVTAIDGDDEVAETGVENPELTLQEGVRYTVENGGWSGHPLAFRAADGEALLSQSGDGSFEGDSETDWVDDEDSVSFTLTGELADELDNYVCTIHGSMEGSIRTLEAQDSDAPAAVEFSDQSTDGTSVVVDSARLDDGGFVTIHDSTLLDGDPLGSVVGVSEYLAPGSNEDIEVAFDEELTESDTLIAMPHRDTNGNEEYDFVDTEGDEDGPYAADGDAVTDAAEVEVAEDVTAEIGFGRQATASSTFTAEEPTAPGVLASGVSADADSAVVVTYEDGEDLVIAGLDTFTAADLDGSDVVIPVEDAGGFPGEHVAHVIPLDDLSGEYAPGDTVSAGTTDAVAANEAATVLQATLSFDDQTAEGSVAEGEVMATVDVAVADGAGGETPYTVDVHPTDDDGNPVGPEYVGSSMVLAGENPEAEIIAEAVPENGDRNGLPFEGTGTFVAMIHLPDADSDPGAAATPGSFPVLPNVDAESGAVPGGVTDTATITAEVDDGDDDGMDDDMDGNDDGMDDDMDGDDDGMDDDMDGNDDGMDDEMDSDDGMNGDDSADDDGPGFGPMAGVAGLGGLAAYAYRKLGLEGEPATPEGDGLDNPDE